MQIGGLRSGDVQHADWNPLPRDLPGEKPELLSSVFTSKSDEGRGRGEGSPDFIKTISTMGSRTLETSEKHFVKRKRRKKGDKYTPEASLRDETFFSLKIRFI